MDVIGYGNPMAETVLIQMAGDHDIGTIKNEYDSIKENIGKEFRLIAMKVDNWNRDLSPWEAPAVFGKEGFGEGALNTLSAVRKYCADQNRKYYIGGYSLAGLFALWAAYQTDLFQGVAAASPSIWFPKFTEYMKAHEIKCHFHIHIIPRKMNDGIDAWPKFDGAKEEVSEIWKKLKLLDGT